MDPPPPQPPFLPLPTATISATAVPAPFQAAAPTISTAQIIAEAPHNHTAHVANATPTVTQTLGHPPYADMIYAAITALKERDGSSKRAIAKYIESVYTGLPPTHSALLTHHLKRLKNAGLLEMVKKSYKLPRSDSTNDNNTNPAAASPTQPHPVAVPASFPSGPRRGRGRPPKPKPIFLPDPISSSQPNVVAAPNSQPNAVPPPISQPVMVPVGLSISTQPNFAPAAAVFAPPVVPPIKNLPNATAAAQLQMESKRGPGRPKKVAGQGGAMAAGKRRGRPPKGVSIGPKKSPGRPRKPKSVAANGVKKGPKRLPKSVVVPYATGGAAVLNVPRPRGRPKKGAVLIAPGGGVVVSAKKPGRPPKVAGVVKAGSRAVGRPKKAATEASQEAYGDLKTKFEFLQSRVKHAVGLLKPTITSETAITAIAAIQELEELVSIEINTPLIDEAPQQLPAVPPQAPLIQS